MGLYNFKNGDWSYWRAGGRRIGYLDLVGLVVDMEPRRQAWEGLRLCHHGGIVDPSKRESSRERWSAWAVLVCRNNGRAHQKRPIFLHTAQLNSIWNGFFTSKHIRGCSNPKVIYENPPIGSRKRVPANSMTFLRFIGIELHVRLDRIKYLNSKTWSIDIQSPIHQLYLYSLSCIKNPRQQHWSIVRPLYSFLGSIYQTFIHLIS
jgi:hypothetical protein